MKAVPLGRIKVGDHRTSWLLPGTGEAFRAVDRFPYLQTRLFEYRSEEASDLCGVIND